MSLQIDVSKFLRALLSFPLTLEVSDGLNFLLGAVQGDPGFKQIPDVSYFLATIRWETANTFQPVKERRADPTYTHLYELQNRYWPSGFYGRGYVQLTWEKGYRHASQMLDGETIGGFDIGPETLVQNPELVLNPAISYAIAARGMREGWFTGHKLGDYTQSHPPDYYNARKVINGLDRADRIAQYADSFERALRTSRT